MAALGALLLFGLLASVALATSTDFEEPPTSPEPAGDGSRSVAAADLDGDGDTDLAVANIFSANVTILRNNGAGNFAPPNSSPEALGGFGPAMVAAADLDLDGDQDLAVANLFTNNVTILRNNGSGNFTEPATSPEGVGSSPIALTPADIDGDGDQDLAIANRDSDDVTLLRNNGSGNLRERASSPKPAGDGPHSIVAVDVDDDGDEDLAVANRSSNDVTILHNRGTGNFGERPSSPAPVAGGPSAIVAADLNGDGVRDLAVASQNFNQLTFLRNNGSGSFVEPGSSPEAVGGFPASVTAADFDGDGDRDLAVANLNSDNVTILRNGGSGNFVEPGSSPETAGDSPVSVASADLDGDGDPDLAVANLDSGEVTVLKNQ